MFRKRARGEFTADKLPGFMRDRGEVHAFGVPTLDGYSIKICPHRDSWSPAKMPIIDHVDESVIVATAMSGNGFKFAPVWGEMLADMATGGAGRFASELFGVAGRRVEV